jgi:peptidoglycan/LPS O-acetylase OafA/YrhL
VTREENGTVSGGFRPDIQGLRAVAVLLVALDHAGMPHLSGGYVGVDVFFVISGFLITGWLLRRTLQDGWVPIVEFYAARARRILPAATLTIVAVVIAANHYLNSVRALSVAWDAIWSGAFAANIRFSQVGTDYFARDNPPSPLQHFWTLAVEEQFYLVWPALLLVMVLMFRARTTRGHRVVTDATIRRIGLILGLCVVASLIWSIRTTPSNPTGAYFSSLTRAWELGTGALIAIGMSRLGTLSASFRRVLSWIGLIGIMVAATTFTSQTPFPGYAAALPVVGAALVIVGGLGQPASGAGSILTHQPFRLVGDVSYGFYLWHWPILILPMEYQGHSLSLATNLELLGAAFVLSLVTYWVWENPIRHSKALMFEEPRSLILWPVAVLTVVCVSGYYVDAIQSQAGERLSGITFSSPAVSSQPTTSESTPGPVPNDGTGATAFTRAVTASIQPARSKILVSRVALSPLPSDLRVADLRGCDAGDGAKTTSPICSWGDTRAHRTLIVFGDSHAQAWMPALTYFASHAGWRLVPLVKQGCQPTQAPFPKPSATEAACRNWYLWALHETSSLKPQAVILAQAYSWLGIQGDKRSRTYQGLGLELRDLKRVAPRVVLLQDDPGDPLSPVDCLLANNATLGSCTFQMRPAQTGVYSSVNQIAASHGVKVAPTVQWFCSFETCPLVVGNIVVYVDSGHITKEYATQLQQPLSVVLQGVLSGA